MNLPGNYDREADGKRGSKMAHGGKQSLAGTSLARNAAPYTK
jgi:hypothetical protein